MRLPCLLASLGLLLLPLMSSAKLRLPRTIASHMVLQQDREITLWGWAEPRETVTVDASWAPLTASSAADDDGRWEVHLRTPTAIPGDPAHTLTFSTAEGESITLEDVLIGEVWLLSGQSNMELPLAGWPDSAPPAPVTGGPEAIATADHPRLRLFAAGRHSAATPQTETVELWSAPQWTAFTPETIAQFSAIGYFFGRELLLSQEIPVGLIQSVWGGSSCEAWVPAGTLEDFSEFADQKPWTPASEVDNQTPSVLYNGMIAPLEQCALRGVLWYQGETNVGRHETYARLFPALIEAWRREWGNDELAFYFAHLAPWSGYGPTSLQEMWDAQAAALELPHTGLVATLDLGNPDNIHPAGKQPIGYRFALLARRYLYGEGGLVASGPRCVGAEAAADRFILRFEDAGSGLVVPENQYIGFELAGEDGIYHPALATIDEDRLILRSPAVESPRAARYAWLPDPVPALSNREGLPAAPFRIALP